MSDVEVQLKSATLDAVNSRESKSAPASSKLSAARNRKPKKLSTRMNIWIRRIHLFSGLFMLPWVLLYGFTALLFNHPTYMAGANTTIDHFSLDEEKVSALPSPDMIAKIAVDSASEKLEAQVVELAENANARFTRQAFGSVKNDEQDVSVILNLNDGKGYLRKRASEPDEEKDDAEKKPTLEDGLVLAVEADPLQDFKNAVNELLKEEGLDAEELGVRSMPNLEFDAIVDGKPVRMRLSQDRSRGRGGSSGEDAEKSKPKYKSKLSIVGSNPRDMTARSFLLRLHMAHGYGIEANSRWFWAIAVDLMFASMVFWGISGVVMWWQIKRTRRIGFILLAASAIVATWLAIGMHWQLVNG